MRRVFSDGSIAWGLYVLSCALCVLPGCTPGAARSRAQPDGRSTGLYGERIEDPFRSLEDSTSAATMAWVRGEERGLDEFLEGVPSRAVIRHRIGELSRYPLVSIPVSAGGRLFFTKRAVGDEAASLFVERFDGSRRGPSSRASEEEIVAPRRALGPDWQISFFAPSPDGRVVLLGLSTGKSRWVELRVWNVDSHWLTEPLGLTNTLAGVPRWRSDNGGFFYVAFAQPRAGMESTVPIERPRLVFQLFATEGADNLRRTHPPPALVYEPSQGSGSLLSISPGEGWLAVSETSSRSPGNKLLVFQESRLLEPLIVGNPDSVWTWLGSEGDDAWALTYERAPLGRVVRIQLTSPAGPRYQDVIAQSNESIVGASGVGGNAVGYLGGRLLVTYLRDGQQLIRIHSKEGALEREVPLPASAAIWGGFSGTGTRPEVYFQALGITDPNTLFRLNVVSGLLEAFRRAPLPFDPRLVEVRRVFYLSSDRTRVPMLIAHRKGMLLDGQRPALVYGYGAFGWISFIWYQPKVLAWLEMGGVYAQPAIRGGGEYGKEWHDAGRGSGKQNSLADYLAALDWLVDAGYTSPERLVVNGGSASGPLAANVLLARPRGLGAVVIDRPILDLLRFHRFTQGAYWASEFGSPDRAEDFPFLKRFSPYHNVRPGTCYPPTLVMSGDLDQTAVPAHAYKFTAALQKAQACERPIFLKVVRGAAHNIGSSEAEAVDAFGDELTFLAKVLELPPPTPLMEPRGEGASLDGHASRTQ